MNPKCGTVSWVFGSCAWLLSVFSTYDRGGFSSQLAGVQHTKYDPRGLIGMLLPSTSAFPGFLVCPFPPEHNSLFELAVLVRRKNLTVSGLEEIWPRQYVLHERSGASP